MRYILFFSFITFTMNSFAQEQSSKHFWHTLETSASPEEIWNIWIDVENWRVWDKGLKDAEMKETFSLNAKGSILSLEGRKSKFKVVEFEEGKSYTFKTKLPFGGLYVKRSLEVREGTTFFTHEVWFSGILGGVFAKKFGEQFREMLPQVMTTLKEIAEKKVS